MTEILMHDQEEFIQFQKKTNLDVANQIKDFSMKFDLLITQNKLLETQVAQQAASSRQQGYLLPKHDCNPNTSVKAITLRSGMAYDGPEMLGNEIVVEQEKSTEAQQESQSHAKMKQSEGKDSTNAPMPKQVRESVPKYVPPHRFVPFPERLVKTKLDKQYGKFVELLKQLNVNMPFTDIMTQMPTYAKNFKEILSNRRKLEEEQTITLIEKIRAIVMNKLPHKLRDLGRFTVPYAIGNVKFNQNPM
jgi:hypothetical protein